MEKTAVKIRAAKRSDSEEIGDMAMGFADYLRSLGDKTNFRFNAKTYLRDGFERNPAFKGLVAEVDGRCAGYLLYHFGYDTDRATKIVYVVDLYVRENYRRRGVARALMEATRAIAKKPGAGDCFGRFTSPTTPRVGSTGDWALAIQKTCCICTCP